MDSPSRSTIVIRRIAAVLIVLTAVAAIVGGIFVSATAQGRQVRSIGAGMGDVIAGTEAIGVDDGYIEEGESISPFDEVPAVENLDQSLREAMQAAARDAEDEGYVVVLTSGWRSGAYQQSLLDAAIREYGSEEEARQWVNTPEQSTHVKGLAVDIGYTDADDWFNRHGAEYGLCQTYANEIWHFELATTPGGECPPQLADATQG